jgi:hypothetical protein
VWCGSHEERGENVAHDQEKAPKEQPQRAKGRDPRTPAYLGSGRPAEYFEIGRQAEKQHSGAVFFDIPDDSQAYSGIPPSGEGPV